MALPKPRVVVGLDFGNAYSGFAFAHATAPERVSAFYDYPRTSGIRPRCKTLTGIYYKQIGSKWQFQSWGYPARAEYERDLAQLRKQRLGGPSNDPLQPSVGEFFTNFKVHLAGRDKGPSSVAVLPPGITVNVLITDYLRAMGALIVDTLQGNFGPQLTLKSIQWCVPVPSIWDNAAKAVMKACMTAAGLVEGVHGSPHPLIMVPELEAASFFCYKVMSEQTLVVGDKLLVADIGGATADIVVQEVVSVARTNSYRVKEVTAISGDLGCGGTYVDQRFMEFLHNKIGPCLHECISKHPNIYAQLIKHWESVKVSFGDKSNIGRSIEINLPSKLIPEWENYDRRMGIPERESYDDLEISYQEMQSIFDPVVDRNAQLIGCQLEQVGAVKVLVVVGGFAGSPYLMDCIQNRFAGIVPQITSPPTTEIAVCKGAVMLAHDIQLSGLRQTTFVNESDSKIQIEYNGDVYTLNPKTSDIVSWFASDANGTLIPKISLEGVELISNISPDDFYGNRLIIIYKDINNSYSFQTFRESVRETISSVMEFLLRMEELLEEAKLWRTQCEHLVKKYWGGVQIVVRELVKGGPLVLQNWSLSVQFLCSKLIYCMLEGEALLLFCSGSDNYTKAAFALSSPPPSMPTFSRFSVVLRELDWIVDFSFYNGQHRIDGDSSFGNWQWCEKRCRLVYNHGGVDSMKSGVIQDETLEADVSRQTNDRKALQTSLDNEDWTLSEDRDKLESIWRKRLLPSFNTPGAQSVPECFWLENPADFIYVDHLASGGFKVVTKSKWLGNMVAVAIVTNVSMQQLVAEAGLLARVQHPNVVELMGCAFQEGDSYDSKGFIVTELMEQDLESLIRCQLRRIVDSESAVGGPPFALQVAVDMALQIVEAMVHLKDCGVIHRDLKPSNCLASPKYRKDSWSGYDLMYYSIKLTDFGTSKLRGEDSYFHTKKIGTASYMAPELYGKPEEEWPYTWSADVYSFGMTCYKIFTGKAPFETNRLRDISRIIGEGKRPSFPSQFPRDLLELIEKCWAQNPRMRPTFKDIRKDLWLFKSQVLPFE